MGFNKPLSSICLTILITTEQLQGSALTFTAYWLLFDVVQVTNPAIDSLREGLVMSLEINLGKLENLLEAGPQNAAQVCIVVLSAVLR